MWTPIEFLIDEVESGCLPAELDGCPPNVRTVSIALPDGQAALTYSRSLIGTDTKVYNSLTNSCLSHCGNVLNAGGLNVPTNSTLGTIKFLRSLGGAVMSRCTTITECLAGLVLEGNVPLEAVAIAGEMITLDARMTSYDAGASRRASLEIWAEFAEGYDVLLQRTRTVAADFLETRDGHALIRELFEIKKKMAEL